MYLATRDLLTIERCPITDGVVWVAPFVLQVLMSWW
jgi:hypothetical protein